MVLKWLHKHIGTITKRTNRGRNNAARAGRDGRYTCSLPMT